MIMPHSSFLAIQNNETVKKIEYVLEHDPIQNRSYCTFWVRRRRRCTMRVVILRMTLMT